MKKYFGFLVINAILLSVLSTHAQSQSLEPGKLIAGSLDPHTPGIFNLHMDKGQFAAIRVSQQELELIVLVFDPLDTLIQMVDENSIGFDEVITIPARIKGNYRIEVRWNNTKPLTGRYSIVLTSFEALGNTPEKQAMQLLNAWYRAQEPGAAIAVVHDTLPVFIGLRGMANIPEQRPITSVSGFELASVSKQFTAFAIAMLIDQNRLSLADDIRKYLPEIPDYGSKITVANLLYHTSGLRNWTEALPLAGVNYEDVTTLQQVLGFVYAQRSLKFVPGSRHSYCNTNYNLLSEIVSRVTGKSFTEWTRENIFLPLGMYNTFFKQSPGDLIASKVLSYQPWKNGYSERPLGMAVPGASSLSSTLDDLVKWVAGFYTRKLISDSMSTLLATTGILNDGSKISYGFGNNIEVFRRKYEMIRHLGLVVGYRTSIARFPQQGISVIYLSNDNNDASYPRSEKLARLFLADTAASRFNRTRLQKPDIALEELARRDSLPSISLSPFKGLYFSAELSSSLTVEVKDRRLYITHPRLTDIMLRHQLGDNFGLITFIRNDAGTVSGLRFNPENLEFRKIE